MNFFKKPFIYASLFSLFLTSGVAYSLLKTFVLSEAISTVTTTSPSLTQTESLTTSQASITENSYTDDNITIQIETIREQDTTVYVADIQVSSPNYLKTALAQNTFGTILPPKPLLPLKLTMQFSLLMVIIMVQIPQAMLSKMVSSIEIPSEMMPKMAI